MADNIKLIGKKGNRRFVKTISVQEDSYNIINNIVNNGFSPVKATNEMFIQDIYNTLGGNCYGNLIIMAIKNIIAETIYALEHRKLLAVKGEKAYHDVLEVVFPSMCYTTDEDGATIKELRFFNTDIEEVIDVILSCVKDSCKQAVNNMREFMEEDNRPAGEIALGNLAYLATVGIENAKSSITN